MLRNVKKRIFQLIVLFRLYIYFTQDYNKRRVKVISKFGLSSGLKLGEPRFCTMCFRTIAFPHRLIRHRSFPHLSFQHHSVSTMCFSIRVRIRIMFYFLSFIPYHAESKSQTNLMYIQPIFYYSCLIAVRVKRTQRPSQPVGHTHVWNATAVKTLDADIQRCRTTECRNRAKP